MLPRGHGGVWSSHAVHAVELLHLVLIEGEPTELPLVPAVVQERCQLTRIEKCAVRARLLQHSFRAVLPFASALPSSAGVFPVLPLPRFPATLEDMLSSCTPPPWHFTLRTTPLRPHPPVRAHRLAVPVSALHAPPILVLCKHLERVARM